MPTYETILFSVHRKTATITLNRPEKRNAFNPTLVAELKAAFAVAETDQEVKVIVLAANGPVFSAGADLGYLQSLQENTYEENLNDSESLMTLYRQIYTLEKPVIAMVHGHAIAGGCGLVTVCDFAISTPVAKFGYTEVKIGFVPAIVMVFLLRKTNERVARELLLTGKLVTASEAVDYGLVNKVVAEDKLEEAVIELSQALIEGTSRNAVTATKQMMARVQEMSLDEALYFAAEINAQARATDDCKYGISQFLQKDSPIWE